MSYEFPLDYSKVREFARAVKTDDAAHTGTAPVIPPTMLTSGRMIWEPAEQSGFVKLGFDRRRILHGEEEYVFHGPLPARDRPSRPTPASARASKSPASAAG